MATNQSPEVAPYYLKCSKCSLRKLCLPDHLPPSEMTQLEEAIEPSSPYHENQKVYAAEQRFDKIFAVKSGMVKTVLLDKEGNERIIGFHLPGELLGLDAIYPKKYLSTAIAVVTSSLCQIHFDDLESLATKFPSLQHHVFNLMSKEVHTLNSLSVDHTAEQKLAGFVLGLSSRYKQRNYSGSHIHLMMPRRDIANHLNMAPETVSRLFKRFQSDGILEINRTDLIIKDMAALRAAAGCGGSC